MTPTIQSKKTHPPALIDVAHAYVSSRWARGEIREDTRRTFTECLGSFADWFGRERSVDKINRTDVERWLGEMRREQLSSSTARVRLSALRGMCQWAIIEGHLTKDPTAGLKGPKRPHTEPRRLSSSTTEAVLALAIDVRERLVVTLMLEEGLRRGGVASLRLEDIDLASALMVVTEKGGHQRTLPLTELTIETIEKYLAERGHADGPLVQSFANPGQGLTPEVIGRMAGEAIRRAGVQESGHSLRHTCAHNMLDNGASMRDVQSVLGHRSIATTMIYTGFAEAEGLRGFMGRRQEEVPA